MFLTKNLFITGLPGVGKSTLIVRIIEWLQEAKKTNFVGFYTRELRVNQQRTGFEIITTTGQREILAHIKFYSPFKVSKYSVNIEGFERVVLPLFELKPKSSKTLFIIDEIGKMECYSRKFVAVVQQILNSTNPVLSTIAFKGGDFINAVKQRQDVNLLVLTPDNRQEVFEKIKLWILKIDL
ncbi:MAG: NTPase [Candidatus Sumerlaeia bacterium]|nr:NTPase [Candidatus Sumerlaeia bacterium]